MITDVTSEMGDSKLTSRVTSPAPSDITVTGPFSPVFSKDSDNKFSQETSFEDSTSEIKTKLEQSSINNETEKSEIERQEDKDKANFELVGEIKDISDTNLKETVK